MKKPMALLLVIIFASYTAYALQWPSFKGSPDKKSIATKEAVPMTKVKKANKPTSGKFTTDKNKVRNYKIMKQMDKGLMIIKDSKNVPPVDAKDIHPSEQF